ncbi:MAG: hypothetical protein ABFC96_19030 [Thermoguttaceae bacterium]
MAALWFLASACCGYSQQLDALRKMPADLLQHTGGSRPDAEGLASYNRGGFKSPEFQGRAMHYMLLAIVRGDRPAIDEGWRAIDATFEQQTEAGNFGRQGQPHGGPSAVSIWLAQLDQAILVLRESQFGPEYKERIGRLTPKIHRAAEWLAEPRRQERLKREDADAPNRLLFDALAYGLSGVLTDDARLRQAGRRFVDLAMQRHRADGVFLEKGGHDSSYQAVAALNLQVWLLYFPDKKLAEPASAAVAWELGRVGSDGQIDVTGNTRTGLGQEQWMGHAKAVNLSEVTLCLLYDYARTGSRQSLDAAGRIVERRRRSAPGL